jgi:eukaryotic-like serine/threonine-protein kinase
MSLGVEWLGRPRFRNADIECQSCVMEKTNQPEEGQENTEADASPPADADISGSVVDDYKVLRRLGQGGMGQVYLAQQLSLRRQVALKILRSDLTDNPTTANSLARFKAEAEAVARATHANIVQIYNIGQAGRINYMALEYIEGRNLREYVEKKKPISVASGLKIMVQVAAALQRAGELNIVHRDIKPENILISRTGEVKVADFGLSRCFDRPLSLTSTGLAMGTPLYMSPEQVEAKRAADHRSDIYSFGATCYFMFAGQPPFRGESPIEVAYKHVHKEPEPLAELCPDLPAELCAVIHKMMAKKPEARYQTARELALELARLSEIVRATSPAAGVTPNGVRRLTAAGLYEPPVRRPRRRFLRHGLVAAAVVLALGCGLVLGWYRNRPVPPNPGPAIDDGGAARALFSAQAKENDLLKQVKENYRPGGPLDLKVLTGLNAAVDLGLQYLNENRLDEADAFFKSLCPPTEKPCHGRLLSQLGKATVLALRDEPAESNKQFLAIAGEIDRLEKLQSAKPGAKKEPPASSDEIKIYDLLWKTTPPAASLREMVARALYHNHRNDSQSFPTRLEPLRNPPRPAVKSP